MRRALRLFTVVAPVALGAMLISSSTPGCYGATEIQVQVTTNVSCSPSVALTTQIFTGATGTTDFGTAPAAETDRCLPSEPRVGTLSVVPSGARDDQFELEVVGAVGVSVANCRSIMLGGALAAPPTGAPRTTGCIVARRRVSFRPHKSLTMPVLLSDRCIDVPCGVDQTCDLGICTATADCTDLGCPRERGDVAVDAGPDAPSDAPVDAPIIVDAAAPCGPAPQVVIAQQSIVGRLVASGAEFFYANKIPDADGGTTVEIRRVSRAGGATSKVLFDALPPGAPAVLSMIASNGTYFALASTPTQSAGTDFTVGPLDDPDAASYAYSGGGGFDRANITFAGDTLIGYWHSPVSGTVDPFAMKAVGGTFMFATGKSASLTSDVTELLVDDEAHFYGVGFPSTLVHLQLVGGAPSEVDRLSNLGAINGDIALAGRTVYAFATAPTGTGVFRIPRDAIAPGYGDRPWLELAAPPRSMTSDGTALYYLTNDALCRADLVASAPAPVTLASTGANADRVEVDGECVYWVENGSTIMKRSK